jgi:glycosyltransferase involved in cell wall biosynthesis
MQALALRDAGVKIGVVFPETGYWRKFSFARLRASLKREGLYDEDGVKTYRLFRWYMVWFQRQYVSRAYVTGVKRYIERMGKPDIIHVQIADFAGLAAVQLWQHNSLPYVITDQSSAYAEGLYTPQDLALLRPIYQNAQQVISVSNAAAQSLVDTGMCSRDQIVIVPNVVDPNFFTVRPQITEVPSPFRFLIVALMSPVKRLDWLLRAFAQAFPDQPDVVLDIGGDGILRPQLEQLARDLGIADKVNFLGLLSPSEVRNAMQRSHAFLLSSLFECTGIVTTEALMCGLPVVSTACGGPEDHITPEVGLLAPVEDMDAYVAALRQMRANAHTYDPIALHEYAARQYHPAAVSAKLIDIYKAHMQR